jgi:hypothetical protein
MSVSLILAVVVVGVADANTEVPADDLTTGRPQIPGSFRTFFKLLLVGTFLLSGLKIIPSSSPTALTGVPPLPIDRVRRSRKKEIERGYPHQVISPDAAAVGSWSSASSSEFIAAS